MEERIIQDGNTSKNLKGPKIIDTEIGYEQVFNETKDIILEAKGTNEEIAWRKLKVKDELNTVQKVWNLVEMTNQQVNFIQYFDRNNDIFSSLDLNEKAQYNEAYEELKPVITELKKYAKQGMTFSINPKIDSVIEEVLLKKVKKNFSKR